MVIKYKSKPIQISLYKDGEPLLNKNLPEMIKMLREKILQIALKLHQMEVRSMKKTLETSDSPDFRE